MEKAIAILSDIHGNSWALQAVINDIEKRGIKKIIDLGDSIYGPLDPVGTYQLLIKQNIKSILGNQDRLIIENWDKPKTNATLAYVISQINEEIKEWLSGMPSTRSVGQKFFACHGTPYNDEEYLLTKVDNKGIKTRHGHDIHSDTLSISQNIILCGHDHTPKTISIKEGKIIVNPGSVGLQAYDEDLPAKHSIQTFNPFAKYCIIEYDDKSSIIEHISVAYDFELAAQKAEKNGRHDWAKWIRTGMV
ncbi:MAG: metallophosphoesterase family protein [Bacteroidales bacterium]|nr:metallophosphoesterase family protein [Bacteroidales bacterium]